MSFGFVLAVTLASLLCFSIGLRTGEQASAAPPLSLEGLLDEKLPEASANSREMLVDNSSCYVCHGNLEEDELVLAHGEEEVSCQECHGKSEAHRNDEDNITPPDKMYAAQDVDEMCQECHEEHDVPARKVLTRWQKRCPQKTDAASVICTDCHFHHRLSHRTVRWDKKTRELIVRESTGPVDSEKKRRPSTTPGSSN